MLVPWRVYMILFLFKTWKFWCASTPFQVGKVASKPLVSGELRTRRNMFRYGRYEVRMKAPDVQPGNPDIDGNWATEKWVLKVETLEETRRAEVLVWISLKFEEIELKVYIWFIEFRTELTRFYWVFDHVSSLMIYTWCGFFGDVILRACKVLDIVMGI